ncbi:hypothetical protein ACLKA7_009483 [Drosophila subpalustris]
MARRRSDLDKSKIERSIDSCVLYTLTLGSDSAVVHGLFYICPAPWQPKTQKKTTVRRPRPRLGPLNSLPRALGMLLILDNEPNKNAPKGKGKELSRSCFKLKALS